jgi:hypothetical protein
MTHQKYPSVRFWAGHAWQAPRRDFSAIGLLISVSIIVLDAYSPGEWIHSLKTAGVARGHPRRHPDNAAGRKSKID